ncbi:hypothetical protein H0H92_008733 [Tricholoma furcatifolium]|nr:hypothetical protein H0H92_008733 [Tricholoma furcatifolium]
MPIAKLPNEILLSIFSELHNVRPRAQEIFELEDFNPKTLFPYAIAAVCRRWSDVAYVKSAFWTRIFAIIDHPLAMMHVQRQLTLSRGREIEFLLMRDPSVYHRANLELNMLEGERFAPFVRIVMANLSRCHSIAIKLVYTSSLPSLSMDFHGPAPVLTSVILRANIDNPTLDTSTPWPLQQNIPPWLASRKLMPFYSPNLRHIDINGRNFVDACFNVPTWLASWNEQQSVFLRLSNFEPHQMCPIDNIFTSIHLIESLRRIPHLDCLELFEVDFRPGETEVSEIYELTNLQTLVWTSLSGPLFATLCTSLAFPGLLVAEISSCAITAALPPSGAHVSLEYNDADSATLQDFFYDWEGAQLSVIECPGFDDAVLASLGRIADCSKDWGLCFHGCGNFTPEGLFRLIDRITVSDKPICDVIVERHPETLSEDKLERLREVIYDVGSWNGVTIEGRRPRPEPTQYEEEMDSEDTVQLKQTIPNETKQYEEEMDSEDAVQNMALQIFIVI